MKKPLTLLALTAALMPTLPPAARGETIWVTGITLSNPNNYTTAEGWYDATKDTKSGISGGRKDNELCWAAASSNLIAWWQQQQDYEPLGPTDLNVIWDEYRDTFANEGGHANLGLYWWLDGSYSKDGRVAKLLHPEQPSGGGYYADFLFGSRVESKDLRVLDTGDYNNNVNDMSADLVSYIRGGYGVELSCITPAQNGHSITLWGVDYNEATKTITGFYVTDSDDYQPDKLTRFSVHQTYDALQGHNTLAWTKGGEEYTAWKFTVLNSRLGNDIHYFNYLDKDNHNIVMKQDVDGEGYTLTGEQKDVQDVVYDGSRGAQTKTLTVTGNNSVHTIDVGNTLGTNFVDVQQGVTLTAEEVVGSSTLTKKGDGTLKLIKQDSSGKITVDGGTLLCENGTLGEITLNSGGTLHGSGKYKNVTVNGGTLTIGNSPGWQQYTNSGVLTLSQATLEFYVAGWEKYASSRYGSGWDSGTYSNIDMSGASLFDVKGENGIESIVFYVGGNALESLSTKGSFSLDIIDGINSFNFLDSYLPLMVENTKFYVADEPGAFNNTAWQAGQDITEYIEFHYEKGGWEYGAKTISLVGNFTGATPPDRVPEPATGTLSLLALAGLCARRRRK